jgi:cell division protein FtsB
VLLCDDCGCGYACSSCLLEKLQEGKLDCLACIKRVAPLIKQLKDENKELKDSNESMRRQIQDINDFGP